MWMIENDTWLGCSRKQPSSSVSSQKRGVETIAVVVQFQLKNSLRPILFAIKLTVIPKQFVQSFHELRGKSIKIYSRIFESNKQEHSIGTFRIFRQSYEFLVELIQEFPQNSDEHFHQDFQYRHTKLSTSKPLVWKSGVHS